MEKNTKKPWIAALSSFFIPGLGQLYNREYKKFLVFFSITMFFFILTKVISSFFVIFSWIITFLSAYDAYQTAKEKHQ